MVVLRITIGMYQNILRAKSRLNLFGIVVFGIRKKL